MSGAEKDRPKPRCKPVQVEGPMPPDWTGGLKRLYDSVVEEPLPDSFQDLLARLDADGK